MKNISLEALLNWSGYKVHYIYKYNEGRYVNIHYRYKARWYSITIWIFCIFTFTVDLFTVGFKEAFYGVWNQFKYRPSKWKEFYLPRDLGRLNRATYIFNTIYTDSEV